MAADIETNAAPAGTDSGKVTYSGAIDSQTTVSYTHLDVYKRQPEMTDEIVTSISERYIELYEHITGEKFVKEDLSLIHI